MRRPESNTGRVATKVAPAIAATTAKTVAAHTALPATHASKRPPRPVIGGGQRARPIDLTACCPLLHDAARADTGKSRHVHHQRQGGNDEGDRLDVMAGPLESDDENRWKQVDRQRCEEDDRAHRPRVPRCVPIPRPLPDAVHAANTKRPPPAIYGKGAATVPRAPPRPAISTRASDGIRTRVHGFAGRCLATQPHPHRVNDPATTGHADQLSARNDR